MCVTKQAHVLWVLAVYRDTRAGDWTVIAGVFRAMTEPRAGSQGAFRSSVLLGRGWGEARVPLGAKRETPALPSAGQSMPEILPLHQGSDAAAPGRQ